MRTRNSRCRGQALVMATLSLIVILGAAGLAVDLGWMRYRYAAARAAAQAAALGSASNALARVAAGTAHYNCGAGGLPCQTTPSACATSIASPPSSPLDAACLYAQANGFRMGGNGGRQSVTVAGSQAGAPLTVSGVATKFWVTTRISESAPQLFSAALGNRQGMISARATAAIVGYGAGVCVYVLDPDNQGALTISGSGSLHANCGVGVNSNNSKAIVVSGSACLNASVVEVVGTANNSSSCGITPAPVHVSSITDPFAALPAPASAPYTCNHTGFSLTSQTNPPALNPGVYCGGITISSSTGVKFNPGIYILNGGGMTISGGSTTVTGNGVMFYDTADATHAYKPISISGGGTATLTPPTSGTYQGILFFQDHTRGAGTKDTISGGSTMTVTGTLYFPNSELTYTGGSSAAPNVTVFVSNTLVISGSSYIEPDADGTKTGMPTQKVMLIE